MTNLKIYFYAVLAFGVFSCSGNDVEDDTGSNPDVENIDLRNFLSTLESWTTYPQSSIDWEHHFDSEGLLLKSVLYEKYPERVIWEIEYLDYQEDQLPIEYQKTYYAYGEPTNFLTWDVAYNDDNKIENITSYYEGSYIREISFPQLDEEMRVKTAVFFNSQGEFTSREVYGYDTNGNRNTTSSFNTPTGSDQAGLIEKWEYTFTHFGDRNSRTYENFEDEYITHSTYSYREDFTLESIESLTTDSTDNPDVHRWWEYDQEERIFYGNVVYGDARWEYVSFLPDGRVEVLEYYQQDNLLWVQTNAEDGTTQVKKFNPEDGSYSIEYYDEEGTVYKVEYYDAEDNLQNTESYANTKASQNLKEHKIPFPGEALHKEDQSNIFTFWL